jgi:phage repressor protein C with HTH and peptisase S24 domain
LPSTQFANADLLPYLPDRQSMDMKISPIRALRKAKKLTIEQLAEQAGISAAFLSRIERGEREPGNRSRRELAKVLGVTPSELMIEGSQEPAEMATTNKTIGVPKVNVPLTLAEERSPFAPVSLESPEGRRDFPIYGSARTGNDGERVDLDQPVEWIVRPRAVQGVQGAFGMYVVGDSMEGRYKQGDMVTVHPGRPVLPGQDVVVVFHDNSALIKRLLRKTAEFYEVQQLNPPWPKPRRIPKKDVSGIYLIVGIDFGL